VSNVTPIDKHHTLRHKFTIGDKVVVLAHGLNVKGRILGIGFRGYKPSYEVEYCLEGDIHNYWCWEDDLKFS